MKTTNHWSKTKKREDVLKKISKGWKNLEKRPFKKEGENRVCPVCGKKFYAKRCHIKLGHANYCSIVCFNKSRRGKIPKNLSIAQKNSPLQKGKCPFIFKGKDHWNWNENNPSYRAVHQWLYQTYGNANKCENPNCIYPRKDRRGNMMVKPKQYQWANITGVYSRDIRNFKQLCSSCHKLFDLGQIKLE